MDIYHLLISILNLLAILHVILNNKKIFIPPTNLTYHVDLIGDGHYVPLYYQVKLRWNPSNLPVTVTLTVHGKSGPPLNLVPETESYTFIAHEHDHVKVLLDPGIPGMSLHLQLTLPPYHKHIVPVKETTSIDTNSVNLLTTYVRGD